MTSGALMSLVAYGAQDVYLTGNPQITHFKVVYRRHTNFAMERIAITMNGSCNFGGTSEVTVTRNGDLISDIYFMATVSAVRPSTGSKFAWVRRLGHAMINSVEVEIGGSRIDKQYGVWLNIWYDLARHAGDGERGFAKLIGDVPELTHYDGSQKSEYRVYVPLQFWFNRHYGLALPLIALQYHEVRLRFELSEARKVIVANSCFLNRTNDMSQVRLKDCQVLVNYVFLDSEERRRFAQVGHEYLIEQVQYSTESVSNATHKFELNFNHPTKELIWAMKNGNFSTGKAFPFYTDDWSDPSVFDDAAKKILSESLLLQECVDDDCSDNPVECGDCSANPTPACDAFDPNNIACVQNSGTEYEAFGVGAAGEKTNNCKITVTNESDKCLWINTNSLCLDPAKIKCNVSATSQVNGENPNSLTNKICADILVDECSNIFISNVDSDLTIRDLSVPSDCMLDVRNQEMVDDPRVNQCNFGVLIDGTGNPVQYARININGHEREERREGNYFNYLVTEKHHTNTPSDGVNVYSFALYPELHQPSGTTNLSRIDNTQLMLWFKDPTKGTDGSLPDLCTFDADNQLWIFALSYNVLRIMSGMGGLAYSN